MSDLNTNRVWTKCSVYEWDDALALVKEFAAEKHKGQKYGVHEYTYHLNAVEQVLRRFNINEDRVYSKILIISAWLHDVLEDTSTTFKEIDEVFGSSISTLVENVTSEKGQNRKERNEKTYPKIKRVSGSRILKLADRIANVEESINTQDSRFEMYKKEYPEFRLQLHKENDIEPIPTMWKHLDSLLQQEKT